jgi:DNA-binding NarL/FixJ family response regulator
MRLLVAGRNAKALARAAGAFADDLTIETAATRVAAIALLERAQFDLILACEKLGDGSGLEVLSHVVVNAPDTLRIFAARPSTLNLLKGELGLFGLFRTLPYPINFRKVWSAIDLVRSSCVESEVSPQVRSQARPTPPIDASPGPRPPTRIPESAAFKRALARRNEAKRRRDPSVTNESLAQLAQLVTTRRRTLDSRATPGRRKRTALFVGSAVFVAGTATLLTFFMLSSNNSIGRSALPLVASSDRPLSEKVLPWQAPTPQPTPTTFVPSDTVPPATADLDAEAKAGLAPFGKQAGYSGPPPPTPPAAPSQPPSYDESGLPTEQ